METHREWKLYSNFQINSNSNSSNNYASECMDFDSRSRIRKEVVMVLERVRARVSNEGIN